jgi:hypothetical protein
MKRRDGFTNVQAFELVGVNLAGAIAAVAAIWAVGLLSFAFSLPSDFWEEGPQAATPSRQLDHDLESV